MTVPGTAAHHLAAIRDTVFAAGPDDDIIVDALEVDRYECADAPILRYLLTTGGPSVVLLVSRRDGRLLVVSWGGDTVVDWAPLTSRWAAYLDVW